MKLSTSTGDFKRVGKTMPERIRLISEAGFRHINLELTDAVGRLDGDDWKERVTAIAAALKDTGCREQVLVIVRLGRDHEISYPLAGKRK